MTTKADYRRTLIAELAARGVDSCDARGKGDGLFVRGRGFVPTATVAAELGVAAWTPKAREARVALPWGDYATIAMLNGILC